MSPYTHPGLDIASTRSHPNNWTLVSPASTVVSSDTIITTPSDLSSEIGGLACKITDASIPRSTETGRFTRHKRFFLRMGTSHFLCVDDVLYRVHRYFFCRDSKVFKTRLSRLPATQEASSPPVISLENVKSRDLDAFLSVLYPLNFNALGGYSFEDLSSILDLSTRWGFTSIRDMAIRCLKPPTAHQRLILGRKYGIDDWILPALHELCERPEPPTRDEARLMGLEDVILVGSVREKVRTHALPVSPVGVMEPPIFAAPSPVPVGVERPWMPSVEGPWTRGPSPQSLAVKDSWTPQPSVEGPSRGPTPQPRRGFGWGSG
ncbi:hypothetical protein BGY98DRAFT_1019453 [Russula aff. rugulosa BPL654]|nr:hypothetical protein BGY98DRAFT_1019453 [Russula aff. rugulosa BPL654]